MKPVDVKDNTSIDFNKQVDYKDPKCKVAAHVNIKTQKYGC